MRSSPLTLRHEFGPAVLGELAGEELALAAQLFGLGVHVVHEFVNQRDGDLLDLRFRVGHLAHENVAGRCRCGAWFPSRAWSLHHEPDESARPPR
jgi:hypothetical protein